VINITQGQGASRRVRAAGSYVRGLRSEPAAGSAHPLTRGRRGRADRREAEHRPRPDGAGAALEPEVDSALVGVGGDDLRLVRCADQHVVDDAQQGLDPLLG
jgi:hypothetical protein